MHKVGQKHRIQHLLGSIECGARCACPRSCVPSRSADQIFVGVRAIFILSAFLASSSCRPEQDGSAGGKRDFRDSPGTVESMQATVETYKRASSKCDGMHPFSTADTVASLDFHDLYRQPVNCGTHHSAGICPTWIFSRHGHSCFGPVLLSEDPMRFSGLENPEPRMVLGANSTTPYAMVSEGEDVFLFESPNGVLAARDNTDQLVNPRNGVAPIISVGETVFQFDSRR